MSTMGKTIHWLSILLIATILIGSVSVRPIAFADDDEDDETSCSGTLASGTYGDVSVEEGKSCTVAAGTIINGDFEADEPVDITIRGSSVITINGNVVIEGATGAVKIEKSVIGGNVEIKDSTDIDADIFVKNNIIGGDIQIENNKADDIEVLKNTLSSNIKVQENTVDDDIKINNNEMSGNIEVQDNTADDIDLRDNGKLGNKPDTIKVDENAIVNDIELKRNKVVDKIEIEENSVGDDLICEDNDPAPTGEDNTVGGSVTGPQCFGL